MEVHLGIYETAGQAAHAFNVASLAMGRGSRPPNEVDKLDAEQVRQINARVHRRMGLEPPLDRLIIAEVPPDPEALLTLFEVTVVGFWRAQAAQSDPGHGLDAAGRRLAEAARLVFWSRSGRHPLPPPSEILARLLARRLDQTFHRSDLIRALLDDDGEDDWRVARWVVYPDVFPAGRGFRDEVRFLYPEDFEREPGDDSNLPHWASVLGVEPPFHSAKVRDAYRARSKSAHPDLGGTHAAFLRLQAAYDEAREYCRVQGV